MVVIWINEPSWFHDSRDKLWKYAKKKNRARYLKDTRKPGMYILKQQFHRYYSTFNQSIQKSTQELEKKQEKLKGKHTSEIHFLM